ncbi:hypothetical protein SU32_08975 [Ahrensia marina]|uniref:Uncharacterized protein n=1 Tax=Ahrensia marina TaxID=1514904 RepID=A0A0N0E7M6_9HYPH|nr:hypothetical protein SU32_08975 [Ahrensia marina]
MHPNGDRLANLAESALLGNVEPFGREIGYLTKRGENSLALSVALNNRNELIRALRKEVFGNRTTNKAAEEISQLLDRYRSTVWPRTRTDQTCRHTNRKDELCWLVLKARDAGLTTRQILNVL